MATAREGCFGRTQWAELAFSPDGKTVAVRDDGSIHGGPRRQKHRHRPRRRHLAYGPRGLVCGQRPCLRGERGMVAVCGTLSALTPPVGTLRAFSSRVAGGGAGSSRPARTARCCGGINDRRNSARRGSRFPATGFALRARRRSPDGPALAREQRITVYDLPSGSRRRYSRRLHSRDSPSSLPIARRSSKF